MTILGRVKGHAYSLNPEQETEIYEKLKKQLKIYVFGSFSLLAVISFILMVDSFKSIYDRAIQTVNSMVISRVSQEFQEPTIKKTIEGVAKNQAKELLEKQLAPQVTEFKKQTEKSIDSIQRLTQGLEARYRADYEGLAKNVKSINVQSVKASRLTDELSVTVGELQGRSKEYAALNKSVMVILDDLNQRKQLNDLAEKAIAQADRTALQQLNVVAVNGKTDVIKELALSEILRVKAFWVVATRTSNITTLQKNGKAIPLAEFSTCELMQTVQASPEWAVRALCLRELGKRKEVGVPEVILNSIKTEQQLEAMKNAVMAWDELTGERSPDVFGGLFSLSAASVSLEEKWWIDNHATFVKKLAALKC